MLFKVGGLKKNDEAFFQELGGKVDRKEWLEKSVTQWAHYILTELPPRTGCPIPVQEFYASGINHRTEEGKLVKDYECEEVNYLIEVENITDLLPLLKIGELRLKLKDGGEYWVIFDNDDWDSYTVRG